METAFPQLIFAVIVCGKMLGIRFGPFAVYALHTNDPQLGVQKVLLTVKAEITRQHVGNGTGQCKQGDALPAKDLDRQTDGRQRAVGAAAEPISRL